MPVDEQTVQSHDPHRVQCDDHDSALLGPVAPDLSAAFEPSLEAPGRVRAILRAALGELGLSEDLIQRGTLAASELAANAVLHARTPFCLLMQTRDASVWIGVEDGVPLQDRQELVGRTPHGLGLIAALALRWGTTPGRRGKLVWAELPY